MKNVCELLRNLGATNWGIEWFEKDLETDPFHVFLPMFDDLGRIKREHDALLEKNRRSEEALWEERQPQ